jgi:hypothetical protein
VGDPQQEAPLLWNEQDEMESDATRTKFKVMRLKFIRRYLASAVAQARAGPRALMNF